MASSDDLVSDPVAAWRAVLLAQSRSLRAIEADMKEAETIPLSWYDVLLELRAAGGQLRMQELGERVVLSRARVSRIVDELEVDELVRREPDPIDGRATFAVITPAGTAAFRSAAPHYLRSIERHFTSHLTADEQRSITTGLMRVVTAHSESAASRI